MMQRLGHDSLLSTGTQQKLWTHQLCTNAFLAKCQNTTMTKGNANQIQIEGIH